MYKKFIFKSNLFHLGKYIWYVFVYAYVQMHIYLQTYLLT